MRSVLLLAGLTGYGVSMALFVRAGLGLDPWDVFHQGLAKHTGLTIGGATDGQPGVLRQALVEDVPRVQAEAGPHEQRHRHAIARQPCQQQHRAHDSGRGPASRCACRLLLHA